MLNICNQRIEKKNFTITDYTFFPINLVLNSKAIKLSIYIIIVLDSNLQYIFLV